MTFIFITTWIILFVWAIRTMLRGVTAVRQERPVGTYTKTVTKPVHPEMVDVEPGTELMGVNFHQRVDDPLQKSLQDRIDELNQDDDEDDIDGEGDIIVRT